MDFSLGKYGRIQAMNYEALAVKEAK